MVKGKCPYCDSEIEIEIAGFAPSTHPEKCPICKKQYHVIDIPGGGVKPVSMEVYMVEYSKKAFKLD